MKYHLPPSISNLYVVTVLVFNFYLRTDKIENTLRRQNRTRTMTSRIAIYLNQGETEGLRSDQFFSVRTNQVTEVVPGSVLDIIIKYCEKKNIL